MRKALLKLPFLRSSHRVQARAIDAEMLESRLMFSASPLAETALNVNELLFAQEGILRDGSSLDTEPAIGAFGTTESSVSAANHQSETLPPESNSTQKRSLELVFVDANTPDYQRLIDDLLLNKDKETDRAFDVYLLDSSRDGVEQISEILSGYRNVDSVHILSHGSDGRIQLGSSWLDSQRLLSDAGRIALWGESLSEDADLLIYGCSLAESEQGVEFIEALASLTQADVAASDDPTGHRSLGGNWKLEYATGEINTAVAVSAVLQEQWFALLDTVVLQEGLNGYSGTVDTFLQSNQPEQDQSNSNGIEASVSPTVQALIRFDDLFGYGPGQIPYGSTITSAQLTLDIKVGADPEADVSLHRLLVPWTDQDTWDTLASGIALDGVEATVAPESTLVDPRTHNLESFSGLTASLQAWSDGETNYGWVIVNNSSNKVEFHSSESPQSASRPQLVVTYEPPALSNTVEAIANSHTSDNQQTDLSSRGSQSSVAVSPNGESVVVWSSQNQDGSGWGVYGQRFASNGHAIGSEFRINETTANDQRWASVAADRTGSFVVTWTSFGQDGTAESVYARRFDAQGNALTNEFRVNSFATGAQRNSVIAMDKETGEFVIAWQGAGPGDSQGVFFRRFHADGSAKDVADRIATTNTGLEVTPAISMTANGNFVIFWIQENTQNDYLYFQQFLASGAPVGNGVQQVDNFLANSAGPSVAADASGNFVVTYREQTLVPGIWTHRYNANGTRNGSYILTAAGDAVSPSISMNPDGSFMIAYHRSGDAEGTGIFLQKYHANGTVNGAATLVNSTEPGNQTFASIASLDANNFVTSWTSSAGGDNNVFMRQFGTASSTPLAISDQYSTAQDTTLIVAASNGVLANDIDPNTSPLSAVILSGPAHGQFTVNLASDGSFSYRPDPGFFGNDSFTYLASNGVNNSVATTVNLSVRFTNVPPTDLHLSNSEVLENVDSTAGFVVGNLTATDANLQDSFSYSIVGGADAAKFSIGGAAGDQLILTDGVLDFENQSNYRVRVRVTDASASTFEKELTISVIDLNDNAPEITPGQSFQISEAAPNGTVLGTIAALDADANATLSNWTITSGNDAGVFALNGNTGQLTLVTNSSLHFASTPRYHLNLTVSDGVNTSSPQPIVIQVLPSGTQPVAIDDSVTTDINTPLNIDVQANDADPELQPLTILDVTSPGSGSVVIQQDGTITYSPATGFLGSDTFEYVISDLQDGLVHYWNLNGDARDRVGGNHGTVQNGAVTVPGSYGKALRFDEINDHVRIPDFAYTPEFTVSFKFKLDEATGGFYQYLYSHGDPDTSNSLNIFIGEDSRSGFAGIMKTVFGDSNDPYNINVLNFDVSSAIGDGQWHSYTLTVTANTGARVYLDGNLRASAATRGGDSFNPTGDLFLGGERNFDSFRYFGGELDSVAIFNRPLSAAEVVDLTQGPLTTSGTASATVSVTVTDRPPTANAGLSYNILEGSPLTLDATSSHDNLGIVSYVWDLNNNGLFGEPGEPAGPQPTVTWETLRNLGISNEGSFTIGLRVTDTQGASDTATTTFVVSNVAPTFVSDPNQTIRENTSFTTTLVATDPADSLSYSIIDGADNGLFTLDPVTGELRLANTADFETPLDFDGDNVYEVVVQVSDGLASATQTVFLRVLDENESPQATNDTYNTAEDATLSVAWNAGILANDTDPEGDALTATLISTTNHGTLLLQTNGAFTYTPSANFHGVDTFSYQTFDGALLSHTATVTLQVTSVNDAPQIQLTDTQLTYVGQALPITVDAGLELSDLDSAHFTGATVTIQNRDPLLSDQLFFIPSAGVTGAFDAATGQLTLSGVASVADYQNVLRSVQLQNMSPTPHAGVRTLVFSVSDGTNSSSDSREIGVQPPIAPPQENAAPEPSDPRFISDAERNLSTPASRAEQDTEEPAPPDSENSAPQQVLPAVLSSPELAETTNSKSSSRDNELQAAAESTTSSASINTANERNAAEPTEADELLYSSGTGRQPQSRVQGTRFSVASTTSVVQSYETPFDPLLLWDDLLQSNQELQQQNELDLIAAGSVVGASGAFTVGYVLWTIRSGLLATSLLAQMPAWRLVDPLMVLDYLEDDEAVADEKQDESVGEMLEQSNASHQKLSALREAQPAEELT